MTSMPPLVPHHVDCHVGQKVRLRRLSLGKSQAEVATSLGVSFQQLQKYEKGQNRIGASRLFEIAQVLDTPVAWFFLELPGQEMEQVEHAKSEHVELSKDAANIFQLVSGIDDEELRHKLILFLKGVSDMQRANQRGTVKALAANNN